MLRLVICLLPLFVNIQAHSAEYNLLLSPESCVRKGHQCQLQLTIKWQLPVTQKVCLLISALPDYRRCFESSNEIKVVIATDKSVDVMLSDAATGSVLAMNSMTVFSHELKQRRRKRNAWSWLQ